VPNRTKTDVSALATDVSALQDEAEDLWLALAKVCQRAQAAAERFAQLPVEDSDERWALKRRSGLRGLQDTLRDFDYRLCEALEDMDRVLEPEVYQ
jgi:hypothetical protein